MFSIRGISHPPRSKSCRAKLREAGLGKKQSAATIAKRVAKTTGQKRSTEQCTNISNGKIGVNRLPPTVETRNKLRDALKGKKWPTVVCPHCGTLGAGNTMHRWHFDNCKEKK